ncbi:MAG: RIP metalloprotease RseP [Pseudomonadota bacterium]|nr:RIP metalloprotease RseP [Pseudomonadota bacterium]
MLSQPPLWFVVIAFIAALGPLIFIHELGHYFVARVFGVGAETFSIGFGPEIGGWTDRRGTRWKVAAIPLGGYVRFVGDADAASTPGKTPISPEERQRSFHLKPVWQRFLIVLAGPAANFLLAILIFAGFFMAFGVPRTPSVVGQVQPGSVAEQIGLRAGDRIESIAGQDVGSFEDLRRIVSLRPAEQVEIVVEREGRDQAVQAVLGVRDDRDQFGQSYRTGLLGVMPTGRVLEKVAPLELISAATAYTMALTRAMIDGLVQIVTGRRSTDDLGGPLKMAQIAGQQATLGGFEFIQLIALFSINLGFINLLPVPMLDGGHLLFYAIEAVRRRPLSIRAQEWAFRGGLALLLALIVFTTANDLGSFGLWEGLGRLIG